MKLLFLTGKLNLCNGITTYLLNLLPHLATTNEIILIGAKGDALNNFANLHIKLILTDDILFDKRNLYFFSKVILKVFLNVLRYKPDVIHSNNHYTANIAFYASRFVYKKPLLVQTIHGDFNDIGILKKYAADRFIVVNRQLLDSIINHDLTMRIKSTLVYNGIEYDNNIKIKNKTGENELRIVTAARLIESKGIQNIIKAFYFINENYNIKLTLTIYGEGEYEEDLARLAKKLNVRVRFLGTEPDKSKIYGATDIFIFPSIIDGFGLTILEAANYYNFIIAADYDGIENIFQDKSDGFTYNRASAEDLFNKIKLAIDIGNDKRMEIANSFRKKVKERFTAEIMAKGTMKVYEAG